MFGGSEFIHIVSTLYDAINSYGLGILNEYVPKVSFNPLIKFHMTESLLRCIKTPLKNFP